MSTPGSDVESFVAKLEQAYPEFRILRPLLQRRAPALLAFECVAHELAQATFHLPEASVAVTKLNWWRDEFVRLAAGEARHPLTRNLQSPSGVAFDPAVFDALVDRAGRGCDALPPRDFAAQLAQIVPVFGAIERLRATVFGTAATAVGVQADLAAATHLLRELARLPFADEVPESSVPMQLLARHQASRTELATPGAARDAIARAQTADIASLLATLGPDVEASAGWLARVRWRCECWRVRLPAAGDPFAALWQRLERAPWHTAWTAWRAQRRER
jgi:phytoene synthase